MEFRTDVMSPSVRRVIDLPRPAWRGRMHRWAIPVAVLAAVALVAVADGALGKATAVAYGLGTIGLYCASAAAHYRVWDPERLHFLFQVDHSMILIFVAASTAPIALVGVGGTSGTVLFVGMLLMTLVGLALVWLPFHPPRGFMNTLFFTVSWWPVLFIAPLSRGLGGGGMALLLAGGLVFTIGALIVGFQRPDPNPNVFGYHEIWHVFVIAGNAVHFVLVWLIVTGNTPL